jgi:hypothetical protein
LENIQSLLETAFILPDIFLNYWKLKTFQACFMTAHRFAMEIRAPVSAHCCTPGLKWQFTGRKNMIENHPGSKRDFFP